MIQIKSKLDCCGCTACASSCPKSAITMVPDEEGFLYPKIDMRRCIECGAYLKRYARKNNLKLVSICLYQSWCDLNINCHPLEFSSYIQFSECVYTTTFHGTIFTLLNHKNCAIYSCSKKIERFT